MDDRTKLVIEVLRECAEDDTEQADGLERRLSSLARASSWNMTSIEARADLAAALRERADSCRELAAAIERGDLVLAPVHGPDPEQALLAEREAHADTRALVERLACAIREAVRMDRMSAALVEADEAMARVRR